MKITKSQQATLNRLNSYPKEITYTPSRNCPFTGHLIVRCVSKGGFKFDYHIGKRGAIIDDRLY